MPATSIVIDFSDDDELDELPMTGTREPTSLGPKGGIVGRPVTSENPKQIRQRARRKMAKLAPDEIRSLYGGRNIDEWDMEELARGRPRAKDGTFKGKAPSFLDRNLHEQIVRRFEEVVRQDMNSHAVDALGVLGLILNDNEVDDKGKARVAAGTKLDAAKFLIEHVIGKPKQRTETDISVKLQGILGHAIVMPGSEGYELSQGFTEAESWEDSDLEEDNE